MSDRNELRIYCGLILGQLLLSIFSCHLFALMLWEIGMDGRAINDVISDRIIGLIILMGAGRLLAKTLLPIYQEAEMEWISDNRYRMFIVKLQSINRIASIVVYLLILIFIGVMFMQLKASWTNTVL